MKRLSTAAPGDPARARCVVVALSVAMAFSAVGCREEAPPPPLQVASQTSADDVRAAVLLRLYSQVARLRPTVRSICVGVEHGEASRHILLALSDRGATLRRPSDCVLRDRVFVDWISGADAACLAIRSVTLVAPGEALAEGSYALGPLAGAGLTYRLEFRLGQWQVVEERVVWVS